VLISVHEGAIWRSQESWRIASRCANGSVKSGAIWRSQRPRRIASRCAKGASSELRDLTKGPPLHREPLREMTVVRLFARRSICAADAVKRRVGEQRRG